MLQPPAGCRRPFGCDRCVRFGTAEAPFEFSQAIGRNESSERPNRHRPHEGGRAFELFHDWPGERRVAAVARRDQDIARETVKTYALYSASGKKHPKGGIVKAKQSGDLRRSERLARLQLRFARKNREFVPRT